MGQVSDPDEDAQRDEDDGDDGLEIRITGLPDEPVGGSAETTPDGALIETGDDTDVDDVELDLSDWSAPEHDAVSRRLVEESVPHHWDDFRLVVSRADEERTRAVVDEIGGVGELLDPDRDQVAYDLSDWDDDQLVSLGEVLSDEGVSFDWEDDELFVYEEDEQMVDELIDRVAHPHELAAEDLGEDGGGELLGELFVVADRLQHDPDNHELSVTLLDLSRVVDKAPAPYGLAAKEWDRLRERVRDLSDALTAAPVDENTAAACARDLRDAVRPYV